MQLESGVGFNPLNMGENLIGNVHGSVFGKPGYHFQGDNGLLVSISIGFNGNYGCFNYGASLNFTLGQQLSIGSFIGIQGQYDFGGLQLSGMAFASVDFGFFNYYGSGLNAIVRGGWQADLFAYSTDFAALSAGLGLGQIGSLVLGDPSLSNVNWTIDFTGILGLGFIGLTPFVVPYFGSAPLTGNSGSYPDFSDTSYMQQHYGTNPNAE